jgi:hypothetical protein
VVRLDKLAGSATYSLLFSVNSPESLSADARLAVSVVDDNRVLAQKTLHAAMPTCMYPFARPALAGVKLRVVAKGAAHRSC